MMYRCPRCGAEVESRVEFAAHFETHPRCAVEAMRRLVLGGVTGREIPEPSPREMPQSEGLGVRGLTEVMEAMDGVELWPSAWPLVALVVIALLGFAATLVSMAMGA